MSAQRCTYCGKAHPTALCPSTHSGSSARVNLRCTYCGSNKHTIEYCLKTADGAANRRCNRNGTFLD